MMMDDITNNNHHRRGRRHRGIINLTKTTTTAESVAYPEFTEETSTSGAAFTSFDRLYLEVDDSLSLLSSSLGTTTTTTAPVVNIINNNNHQGLSLPPLFSPSSRTIVDDLEVPTTPVTTGCFSTSPKKLHKIVLKTIKKNAKRTNKTINNKNKKSYLSANSSNDDTAPQQDNVPRHWCCSKCSCWDFMIVALCCIILGGCALLLVTVVQNNQTNRSNSACNNESSPLLRGSSSSSSPQPYNHTRNDTMADLELQERRDIFKEWLVDETAMIQPGSPQQFAIDWLGGGGGDLSHILGNDLPSKQDYATEEYFTQLEAFRERITQRYALLVLYFALGSTYPILGWATLSGARLHECLWPNVACDNEQKYVTQLLFDSRMVGQIPSEIGLLSKLETLRIEGTQITGGLPSEIYSMTNLYSLAVTNTGVLSKLQPTIGNLSNLTSLDLRRGGFVGSLPTELGLLTTLRYLMLDTNDLVGSIPTELGTMTILETATFHDTWVSGAMPPSICQLRAPSASLKNLTANCKLQDESSSLSTDIRFLSSLRVSCECCTMCL